MKKHTIVLILAILAFGLIGCDFHNADRTEESSTPSLESVTPTQKNDESNSKNQEVLNSQAPDSDLIKNENTGDTDAPPAVACSIEYLFSSVKDLNTYITTGSTDIEDYLFAPHTPFNDMPEAKLINAYGYNSIYEYFTFDETTFDSVEASFTFTESGSIIYKYYFDNIFVTIQPVESDNLLECYKSRKNIVLNDDVSLYTKNNHYANGHMLRENLDCNIMYYVVNGVKKEAHLIIGNSYVTINGTWYSDNTSLSKDFNEFMANKDVTAFSSFFSDDDIVFNNAIAKMKAEK